MRRVPVPPFSLEADVTRLLRLPEPTSSDAPVRTVRCKPSPLTEDQATRHLIEGCFTAAPPSSYGVELEWLVHDRANATRPAAAGPALTRETLVRHGRLTTEPGGQLEYSSAAAKSLDACAGATEADMARLRAAADELGLQLVGFGMDPYREPRRVLDLPRYAAMERFFDREGSAGRWMMCATASVQACLDAGTAGHGGDSFRHRWRLAHLIGPVLVAAFANSPMARSRPTGWASTRQAIWSRMDPTRTSAVTSVDPHTPVADPAGDWARYALDAKVLCVRRGANESWSAPVGLTFRQWIRAGADGPTREDLDYHLTTLFPPVRPRGYLEMRMIDAQRADGWVVPLAVCATLLDDRAAGEVALAATEPVWTRASGSDPWRRAARCGLADRTLAAAATACFLAVIEALPVGRLRSAVEEFTEQYVSRGRCPGDDLLDGYHAATARLIA